MDHMRVCVCVCVCVCELYVCIYTDAEVRMWGNLMHQPLLRRPPTEANSQMGHSLRAPSVNKTFCTMIASSVHAYPPPPTAITTST